MTEQYSIGFGEGEQNGYNKAIDECASEINQLKAQVNRFKGALVHFHRTRGDMNELLKAYSETPEQCLAEVKAEAIKDAAFSIISDRKGVFGVKDDEMYQDFCSYADMLLSVK